MLVAWIPCITDLRNQGISNNTVTSRGTPTYSSFGGKIGSGCYTTNTGDIIVPYNRQSTNKITITFWCKINGWSAWTDIFTMSGSKNRVEQMNTADAYQWYSDSNALIAIGTSLGTISSNVWHFFAYTFDGTTSKLYVDNVQKASRTSSVTLTQAISGNQIVFGSRDSTSYCNASYNDIRIYDHCLSAQEVKEISKGLVLHYPLDDGNVTNIVYDCSGYCNNGTITGTLTTSTDTPRYDKCSQGNGNISCSGLTINNPFTISTWIYLPITGTTGNGGSELSIGPVKLYKDHDGVDKHTFQITKSDNSLDYLTRFYPPEDKWYHLAIVSDGSTLKIYKNGVASTNSISTKDGKTNFSIMQSNNIKLSDLRLYATALSEDDIKELYNTAAFIDHKGDVGCYQFYENTDSQVMKTGQVKTGEFVENYDYLYLPAGVYVNTGLQYTGNTCKAETILRYASGGSTRDLMGFSGTGSGYWGVTANGTWEGHGTFSYTNSDITVLNKISYEYTGETGTYQVGALNNSYSSRSKYIYRIKLYKNGVLERDLYPCKGTNKNGLVDVLTGTFYPASANTATLGNDSETRITKVYDKYIECNQLIEI